MKKLIYIIALFFVTSYASAAKWKIGCSIDEMTDIHTCSMSTYASKYRKGGSVWATLMIHQIPVEGELVPFIGAYFLDEPNSSNGMFRVDNNKVIKSEMTIKDMDGPTHMVILQYDILIEQFKKGNIVKISNAGEVVEIDLMGFTKAYCSIVPCK